MGSVWRFSRNGAGWRAFFGFPRTGPSFSRIFHISAHRPSVSVHFSHFRAPTTGFRAFSTFPRTDHQFPRIFHFSAHLTPVSTHFPLFHAPTIVSRAFHKSPTSQTKETQQILRFSPFIPLHLIG